MDNLAKLLMSWATQEMKFQNIAYSSSDFTPLPKERDFEQLCKKPLDDVWRYVLKHVKSRQTVREIKGNIELHRKLGLQKSRRAGQTTQLVSDQNSLQSERAQLARELSSCESDIHQLRKEMDHLASDLMKAELAYQSSLQRVRDLQKKRSVLEVANRSTAETVAKYCEYDQRVVKLIHSMTRSCEGHKTSFFARGIKNRTGDLETECSHDVRLSCEAVEEFLHKIVDGCLGDKVGLENSQKQLWEKIEKVASAHSVSSLVSALTSNTDTAAKELVDKTHQIGTTKSAETVSVSSDGRGGLRDRSSAQSMQKSVQELLLAGNEQHVMRWIQEQEQLNEQWKLVAQLDNIMNDIHKQVHRVMGDQPRGVQLANYIDAMIQLAEEKSVLPCLTAEAASLKNRISKAKQERQVLRLKYEQIQDFKGLVEKKQNIISMLARQNSQAPIKLDSHKQQVTSYLLSRSMNSHAAQVRRLTDDLKNSLAMEVMQFETLDMSCFVTVRLDSETCQYLLDLSIAPSIHPLAHQKLHMYTEVSAALHIPKFKSTDCLFMRVFDIHNHCEDLHLAQERRQNRLRSALTAAGTTDDLDKFIGMCQKAEEHDKAQCQRLLPQLQKILETVSASASKMADFKKQVTVWWEQPAQFTTPWLLVEGMTFEQWLRRWRVAVAQHHKKMIEQKSLAMSQQDSSSLSSASTSWQ